MASRLATYGMACTENLRGQRHSGGASHTLGQSDVHLHREPLNYQFHLHIFLATSPGHNLLIGQAPITLQGCHILRA